MSPIIRTKYFYLPDNISCFIDLDVVLHYEILELSSSYDRINVIFDQYLNQSWKEGTRNSRGAGPRFRITELSEIPKRFECIDIFHTHNVNQYLRERFFIMYHKHQILVCTYQETISSSHQTQIEGNMKVTITVCQSKEADQQLIRNTLHFLSSCVLFYKVVIKTVDTGVMILLIAYLSDIL